MEGQHTEKFQEYYQISLGEKESFFECICPLKCTDNFNFGGSQTQMQFSVNKDIVDVDMFFDPSGYGEVASSRERALAAFTNLTAADEIQDSDVKLQTEGYGINIVNPVQFNLTVDYLTVGVNF